MARDEMVKSGEGGAWQPTRRQLLGATAAATVGFCSGSGFGQASRPAPPSLAADPPTPKPWWTNPDRRRARVVEVRSKNVLHTSVVDPITLGGMLDQGIMKLTQTSSVPKAWQSVLGSSERIVLKFNSVGAQVINTNDALATLLVERLARAGYPPEQLTLVEVSEFLPKQLGTRPIARGWGPGIPLGAGVEQLARYVHEADAIISVPFLKTHQIAGITGCMKNISHAVIRHPARYHQNGCSPYVGQVIGSQEVSSRLRLNLTNAIRIVVDRGPDAREEQIVGYGGLLLGFDPLAVDNVGLSLLFRERRRLGLPAAVRARYLASAARMGLGRWRPAEIELISAVVNP